MKKLFVLGLCLLFVFITSASFASAENVSLESGRISSAQLRLEEPTSNWAGLTIINDAILLSESTNSFMSINIPSYTLQQAIFPGSNFKNDGHYYMASLLSSFNQSHIINASATQLASEKLFSSADFPTFYPGYNSLRDNPNKTFCCKTESIWFLGTEVEAFSVTIPNAIEYYVVPYNNSGSLTPLFLVPFKDSFCYNSSACVGEFLLPINANPYYFYLINSEQPEEIVPTRTGTSNPEKKIDPPLKNDITFVVPSDISARAGSTIRLPFSIINRYTRDISEGLVRAFVDSQWISQDFEFDFLDGYSTTSNFISIDLPSSLEPGIYEFSVGVHIFDFNADGPYYEEQIVRVLVSEYEALPFVTINGTVDFIQSVNQSGQLVTFTLYNNGDSWLEDIKLILFMDGKEIVVGGPYILGTGLYGRYSYSFLFDEPGTYSGLLSLYVGDHLLASQPLLAVVHPGESDSFVQKLSANMNWFLLFLFIVLSVLLLFLFPCRYYRFVPCFCSKKKK
jgi:hypothetical protein